MSAAELTALVCCDLGAIVRGRSLPADELHEHLQAGVSWVPANHALTPLGSLAEPNPFGSTGDLRLLPDIEHLLDGLDDRNAEIVMLHAESGYSDAEIAAMIGGSRSKVSMILTRAREKLRKMRRGSGLAGGPDANRRGGTGQL